MPQAERFELVPLTVPDRDILGPDGATVINPSRRVGAVVVHWFDRALARAWFQEALARARRMQAKYAANDPNVVPGQPDSPWGVVAALMEGYNACNVPWYMHPPARGLWRAHVAGAPATFAGGVPALFGTADYNDQWFTSASEFPGYNPSRVNDPMRALAAATRNLGMPGTRLTPTIFPWLEVPWGVVGAAATNARRAPLYARDVRNDPTVGGGFLDLRTLDAAPPFVHAPDGEVRSVDDPGAPDSLPRGRAGGWRVYGSDWSVFGYKRIGVPALYYAGWLLAWAEAAAAASPDDIVMAARTYTVYQNARTAEVYPGGPEAFVQRVSELPAELLRASSGGPVQTGLAVAATATAAVGAGFAPFTFGISALVGGAISLALSVASATVRTPPPDSPRDEFGRFKPVIERGWLSGDPGIASATGAPLIEIPAPAGWTRPLVLSALPGVFLPATPSTPPPTPPAPGTPGGPPATPGGGGAGLGGRVAGWALGGLLAYGLYRAVVGGGGGGGAAAPPAAAASRSSARGAPGRQVRARRRSGK